MLNKVKAKIKEFFDPMDDEYDYEEYESEDNFKEDRQTRLYNSAVEAQNTKTFVTDFSKYHNQANIPPNVIMRTPKSYEDAEEICYLFKNKKAVVIILTYIDTATAQRILDFLSGCCYICKGDLQKVDGSVYLLSPTKVEIQNQNKTDMHDYSSKFIFKH